MPTEALRVGATIAGYSIEDVLGRGGMAVVYRATHPDRADPVALKLIASTAAWDEGAQVLFERESRLAAAVVHRHILPVFEAGDYDGHPFVAMRLEATDLGAVLRDEGRLGPARAARLLAQVGSALDAAHAHGLVHRDVKPSNVLLGEEDGGECAYVADFGVARAAFSGGETLAGDMVGTIGYASPEQIRGEHVDHRTDVYALGCLLYECLTGRVPFKRASSLATLWAHLHEEPPVPSVLVPDLSPGLDAVIARALDKRPDARYGSAGALAEAALEVVNGRRTRDVPVRRERGALPSGTVTFLFTDVEGSTRLLHSLGAEAYADELAEHRRLIREACARREGVEVDTQGDAFFLAFPTAAGALAAAAEMTEALAAGAIQVRIGLHTGTPHVTSEGYVGEDVHRAARIAAAGHGGQVLVSASTAEVVDSDGGASHGSALRSLGAHRLKDFEGPVNLYQLGEGSFPALKTIANTNLPTPVSSFLGREAELVQADALLTETRLLTIYGPGGQGKTRFALELARRAREERFSDYEDGVFSCFLAPLRDPALVLPTIAQTLSVPEQPGMSALDALAAHLEGRKLLLLLDNLEHLLAVASELSELLSACPELTLLVTSRELLRLSGERPYDLPPLPEEEGVALFCERAHSEPTDTIRTLCARLEGLPLAIELAAARMTLLSPEQLLERLSQRLDLLKGTRDADPRQQTLRATIRWSYDLLSPEEQRLFSRLSVFAGGCTLEAAEEVCDADLDALESLLDKSLLRRLDSETGPRFWMLETIREYAGERLEASGEEDSRRERHLAWYASLAIELAEPLRKYSPQALVALEHELDNMRAALAVAVDRDEVVRASDLMSGLWFYWLTSGRGEEARAWADRYLASSRQSVGALERFGGDLAAAEILRFTGDPATAADLKRERVATGRAHPNAVIHGVAIERSIAATLSDLAYIELDAGRLREARSYAAEALALRRDLGLPNGIAHALMAVAAVEYNARDFGRARDLYAEASVVSEGAGLAGDALEARLELAECELLLGRLNEAEELLRDGLAGARSLQDHSFEVLALRVAAMLAAAKGEAERSAILLGALDANLQEGGLTLFGPVEEELKSSYLDRVQRDLGETRFRAAYQRGMRERESIELDDAFFID